MGMDNTKVFGDTYWGFQVRMICIFASGASFMPYNNDIWQ